MNFTMDISAIARKLGLAEFRLLVRKAEELRLLSNVQFDSSVIGIGEVCKAVICVEIAASQLQILFDRQSAIRLSGMSEKAYMRLFNAMQNGLGVRAKLDVRELAIQFGCVRLIPFVERGLSLYKDRFLAALPASRRANTDFNRPVFTAVAFYLCAKGHKLRVDKLKLIELCGTCESEFTAVSTSMKDLFSSADLLCSRWGQLPPLKCCETKAPKAVIQTSLCGGMGIRRQSHRGRRRFRLQKMV